MPFPLPPSRIFPLVLLLLVFSAACKKNGPSRSIPVISGVSPSSDTIGAKVIITGNNFNATADRDVVEFNGVKAVITAATANQLTVIVPAGATTGPVTVIIDGAAAASANPFTVANFSITELVPSIVGIGYPLIIKGRLFDPIPGNNLVTINGLQVPGLAATDSQLIVQVPAAPVMASSGKVVVTTSKGRIYTSANDLIVKKATVTTIGGFQALSLQGPTDGPLNVATFLYTGMAFFDPNGTFYFIDEEVIRKITPDGMVSTVAGAWNRPGNTDGPVSTASFLEIGGIAMDKTGNIYVSNSGYGNIRKIDVNGNVTSIAGQPAAPPGWHDGTGSAASFNNPQGIAVDANNNVYVADCDNNLIRKISPAGEVTTFAGNILRIGGWGDGQGTNAFLNKPTGMVIDQAGNLYVTEPKNSLVRKITPAGYVTTLAGTGGVVGNADGQGAAASFDQPTGIALDANGNIYVTDYNGARIRMITPGGMVTTLAGNSSSASADGIGFYSLFGNPNGIAVNKNGIIYVLDFWTRMLRKIVVQ